MDRAFESGASATPPTAPGTPSIGFATDGNPSTGVPATLPGEWWFHAVTEELRNLIGAAGLAPNYAAVNQVAADVTKLILDRGYLPKDGSEPMTGALIIDLPGVLGNAANDAGVLTFFRQDLSDGSIVTLRGEVARLVAGTSPAGVEMRLIAQIQGGALLSYLRLGAGRAALDVGGVEMAVDGVGISHSNYGYLHDRFIRRGWNFAVGSELIGDAVALGNSIPFSNIAASVGTVVAHGQVYDANHTYSVTVEGGALPGSWLVKGRPSSSDTYFLLERVA
jgi:hypothetical protein